MTLAHLVDGFVNYAAQLFLRESLVALSSAPHQFAATHQKDLFISRGERIKRNKCSYDFPVKLQFDTVAQGRQAPKKGLYFGSCFINNNAIHVNDSSRLSSMIPYPVSGSHRLPENKSR